jgi:hypothetical protein
MNPMPTPASLSLNNPVPLTTDRSIAQLVGDVYVAAPPAEKSRLLTHLIQPLGVLSLVAIANGIFAKIRFRSSWPDPHLLAEDVQNVQASDVITLVNYVQQVSTTAVDSLSDMLSASPLLTSSAAAALLVQVLLHRTKNRRRYDDDDVPTLRHDLA